MSHEEIDLPAASIIEFCQFARVHGLTVGVQQTLAALEAAKAIGSVDRQKFAIALRAALTSSKQEWDQFLQLFDAFWSSSSQKPRPPSREVGAAKVDTGQPKASSQALTRESIGDEASAEGDSKAVTGASAERRLQKIDFSNVPQDDLAALEEIALRLFRSMSLRLSRRFKIRERADRVDIRRTIRRSIPRGGDPIVLAFQGKKLLDHRLVIFVDISGSMKSYSLFLVCFAYALQKYFKLIDIFVFSTEVVEITNVLRTSDLHHALRQLSQNTFGWFGGTKIGESLEDFHRRYGRKLLSRKTVFMILSDGWDTGEPAMLAQQLRRISQRVQKLIWLNPLLGLREYEPVTLGMAAALPYVDVFASAHNLESLLALEKLL
jgi:uncharacterized protein with von Willebrand factor type A (vWA) domain